MGNIDYNLRSSLSFSVLRYAVLAVIALTAFVVVSFIWNIKNLDFQAVYLATEEARSNWNKDQAFRRWASRHGGLYVKPDERTPPSPYLAHLPHRDVETAEGMKLTLMNPAYMMSQMTKEFESMYGVKGRITGQILLNPENKADPWELNALKQFDKGAKEIVEEANIDGQPYLRLMRPMVMKKGCVKCHGHLGFKVGDIRGGVSVSVPLTHYFEAAQESKETLIFTHGVVWLVGLLTIGIFSWRGQRHEITRRQAENQIKSLSKFPSENPHPILRILKNGKILYKNKACDVFSKVWDCDIGNAIPEKWQGFLSKAISSEKTVMFEDKYEETYFSFNMSLVEEMGYVNVYGMDITSKKQADEKLRLYSDELKRSNQELQDFTSIASHDLQEPLRKVIIFGDRLKEKTESLDDAGCDYIDRMQNATMRMQVLLDDLLSYSRLAVQPRAFGQVDLNSIVEECLSDLEYRIVHAKGTVNVEDLPTLQADPSQIGQLFQNLIGNALKYHRVGISPVINIYSQSSEDGKIEIVFEDNGIGLEKKYSERIFQPFQRLHGRSEYEGTGIGLAICKKIVDRHNGTITVKSTLGEGSKFILTLPEKQT